MCCNSDLGFPDLSWESYSRRSLGILQLFKEGVPVCGKCTTAGFEQHHTAQVQNEMNYGWPKCNMCIAKRPGVRIGHALK